jgi:hypothetical protein
MAITFLQAYPWLALLLNLWLATSAGCVIYLLLRQPQVQFATVQPQSSMMIFSLKFGQSFIVQYGRRKDYVSWH